MPNVPKKVVERYKKTIPKFQRALKIAQDRDVNEADTVVITQDILSDVFGYDKYIEITSEYAIRNTYCDLAIKFDEKIQFLIEVKAIGLHLKENHLRQVIDYGANHGVQWVVLTNGIIWELYKIKFERPISHDLVCSLNIFDLNPRKAEDQEKLFLFSKRGVGNEAREDYFERSQSVNRFIVGALILSDSVINVIIRDIRKMASGLKIDKSEIERILRNEVVKRDVIEGDEATKAASRIRRLSRKVSRRPRKSRTKTDTTIENSESVQSEDNSKEEELEKN